MTTAQMLGRALIGVVVIGIALAVWVLALAMADDKAVSRPVRIATRVVGLANLVAASTIAVAVWMAPA